MRIVCPRCVAQYEVDESAIPATGREVQCANCENIWFQDYIEMLPDRAGDISPNADTKSVFDDLDDASSVNFHSKRSNAPEPPAARPSAIETSDDEEVENLLADTSDEDEIDSFYDDEDADDDDQPATNIPLTPVNEDVLNVLRSEAAFSSASAAREQLDAAAANAIDGDGEERKLAADKAHAESQQTEAEPEPVDSEEPSEGPEPESAAEAADLEEPELDEVAEPAAAEIEDSAQDDSAQVDANDDGDLDFADLTAFLDAHSDTENEDEPEEEPEVEDDDLEEEVDARPTFDPLSDLEAIRSQLDSIGAERDAAEGEEDDDDGIDYTPILPSDDPISALSDAEKNPYDQEDSLETDDGVTDDLDLSELDDTSDLLAAVRSQSGADESEADDTFEDDFDDLDDERPRHAYRADGAKSQDDDPEDDDPDTDEVAHTSSAAATAATVSAALGMSRPRAKNTQPRARIMQGFGLNDGGQDPDFDQEHDDAPKSFDDTDQPEPTQAERKSLLPDVEELDASLRSEADHPRRRDREMREAHEEEIASKSGGFRRAFVWTVFVFAVLFALYLLRPMIVATLPGAAVVLDPYAAAIDSLRLLIDKVTGS